MSSTRHAVVFLPSLTCLGYSPLFTFAHQVDLPTGISFKISGNLKKPVSGSAVLLFIVLPHVLGCEVILLCTAWLLGDFA